MPISTPTLPAIAQSGQATIATRLQGADATPPRSVLGVLVKVLAGAVDGLYGAIQTVADDIIYDTASTDALIRWAAIWGIRRDAPTAASGAVQFTGAANQTVPAGILLARADGVQYGLTSAVALDGTGAGTGTVICTGAGAITNTAAGGTLRLTSAPAGVASTATVGAAGLTGGNDIETPEHLLEQLLQRIRETPQGGSNADYEGWALSVPGVTRVWVYPWWQGTGTVGVTFMMDGRANAVPAAADVAAVQAAIDAVRPVAAPTFVFAPTPQPLAFTIHLNPDSAAIRAAVTAQLASLIANQCVPGGTLLYTHIWAAISAAAGEVDFTLQAPLANVTAPAGSIITLGAIAWV
jgi:uncharacterized phage protein gp47/JayE